MGSTRVLVAYATKTGSTAGIAQAIGEELRALGLEADVRPAAEVRDVTPYGAVVLGSAIYIFRWRREAIRFGKRNARALRERPVWLFGSGPIDTSADEKDIPPVKNAAKLAARIGARGHVTFGGRLTEDTKSAVMKAMVEKGQARYGDFRNFERIRAWARGIGAEIAAKAP